MRDWGGLHYIVESLCRCADSLSYVIALLALRLQTGTKPKWQMGRKGRRSCDAGAEIFNRKRVAASTLLIQVLGSLALQAQAKAR